MMENVDFFGACLDPELSSLLSELPTAPKTYTENLPAARVRFNTLFTEGFRSVQRAQLPPDDAYIATDHSVPVDGGVILVRTYHPSSPHDASFPLFVWTHGGGFVFGDVEMDDYYMRILAVDLQIVIANVEYRLAPEHPFPISLSDAYAAVKWAIQNAKNIRADPAKGLLIGGQSAGANFPAVITHRAKIDPFFVNCPITGQVLQIPVLLHPDAVPEQYADKMTSYATNYDPRILNEGHMRDYFEKLRAAPTDPELSVLLQPSFTDLPPVYMQVCGRDPLRDEALVYGNILQEPGVAVKIDEYPGVPHGFHLGFPTSQLAQKFDRDFRAGIIWLLGCPTASPGSS